MRVFGPTPMKFRGPNTQQKQHHRNTQSLLVVVSGLGVCPRQLFAFGVPQIQPPCSTSRSTQVVSGRISGSGISHLSNGWQMMVWLPPKHSRARRCGSKMALETRFLCGRNAMTGGSSNCWRILTNLGIHFNLGQVSISGHISSMR